MEINGMLFIKHAERYSLFVLYIAFISEPQISGVASLE